MTTRMIAIAALALGLAGCTAGQVVDNTVDATGYVTKQAAKGAYYTAKGATKMVYRGGKWLIVGSDGEVIGEAEEK